MNIWMDIAIPLIATCAASIICNIVTLWLLNSCKAENEVLHEEYGGCIIARDSFKLDLEACQDEHKKLSQRVVDLLVENGALNLKLKEAQKPRTRVSRAKPPLAE